MEIDKKLRFYILETALPAFTRDSGLYGQPLLGCHVNFPCVWIYIYIPPCRTSIKCL